MVLILVVNINDLGSICNYMTKSGDFIAEIYNVR